MELIKCFKALSDKTRLRLLYVLNQYELSVNEIVQVVDMIQSGVSRHLKILLESGLLTSRRDGSFIYYSAVKTAMIAPLVDFVEQHLQTEEIALLDLQIAREMIQARQNKTRRFFKAVAPQWDVLKKEVLGELDLNAILIRNIEPSGNIADLGCGTGELIEQLMVPGVQKVIGVDSSPEMLEQARVKLLKTGAELRLGELEHLPMKNRQMDTAVMNMVLHHIPQPLLPIAEAFRVLRPGGMFLLSDFEKHHLERIRKIIGGAWLGFEKEKIGTWLAEAGFVLEKTDAYPINHGLTVNIFFAKKP